jgi:hypothetical protein
MHALPAWAMQLQPNDLLAQLMLLSAASMGVMSAPLRMLFLSYVEQLSVVSAVQVQLMLSINHPNVVGAAVALC